MTDHRLTASKAVHGAVMLSLQHVGNIVLSAVTVTLLGRWLAVTDFGIFAQINFWVFAAVLLFGDLGLGLALVRIPEDPTTEQWNGVHTTAIGLAVLAVFAVWGVAGVLAVTGNAVPAGWLIPLGIALGTRFLRTIPNARLQREQRFGTLAVTSTVEGACYSAIVLVLASMNAGVSALVYGLVAKEIVGCAMIWWLAGYWHLPRVPDKATLRKLLRVGLPTQLSGIFVSITGAFQPIFIGGVLGATVLGYVSWAYTLTLFPILLLSNFDRVLLPTLARVQEDKATFISWTERAIRFNCLITFPIVLGLFLTIHELIQVVFTPKWFPAEVMVLFFLPWIAITAINAPIIQAFNALGRTRVAMVMTLSWAVATWSLGTLMTSRAGMSGFGWFYVVLQLSCLPVWALARGQLGVRFWPQVRGSLAGLIVGGLAGYFVQLGTPVETLFAKATVGGAAFVAGTCIIGRGVAIEDAKMLVHTFVERLRKPAPVPASEAG